MEPATIQRSPSGPSSLVQPAQNGSHPPEDEMKDLEQLIDVGTTILNQALDLVNDSLTSDEQLTVHSQYMPGSTIGTNDVVLRLMAIMLELIPSLRQTSSSRARPLYSLAGLRGPSTAIRSLI
jgi:hypothetical protein